MRGGPHVVDGEVCVLDDLGRSDFNRLQDRARRRRWVEGGDAVTYCVFDLLFENGKYIRMLLLLERKARLFDLWTPPPAATLYVNHFENGDRELFDTAVQ